MATEVKRLLAMGLAVGVLGLPARALFAQGEAEDEATDGEIVADEEAAAADAGDEENKLLKLVTLEEAFFRSLGTINRLQRYIAQETKKLEDAADDEAKAAIEKDIANRRAQLQNLSNAMDVIFGIGRRRTYEYNRVTSTVYLRVGTVEEAFTRAVQTRDALKDLIAKQQALKEAETDEVKKAEIDQQLTARIGQYRVVAAALQLIYGVTPQRNYFYNDKDSTLYLRISDNQLATLQEQLTKQQEERAAAAAAAEAAAGAGQE